MSTWTVILAGGSGSRLTSATKGVKKQFLLYQDKPLFWHSAEVFGAMPSINGLVIVLPEPELAQSRAEFETSPTAARLGLPVRWAKAGRRRQDSSGNGLQALPDDCHRVLVHDAARPFVTAALTQSVLNALDDYPGVIPGLAVADTIKRCQAGLVTQTLPREELFAIQTPQGFRTKTLTMAHSQVNNQGLTVTDDAAMLEYCGQQIKIIPGDPANQKITVAKDLDMLIPGRSDRNPCMGFGYDVHRYGPGRVMKLGGVPITNAPQVQAHSDGDVLLHALIDALLGCLGQGDLGEHFPDNDPELDNANSGALLTDVLDLCRKQGLCLRHVDLTLVCQTPRLRPWKSQIRNAVAAVLNLPVSHCNLKATTEEGLGFTGQGQGIKAIAVVTADHPLDR